MYTIVKLCALKASHATTDTNHYKDGFVVDRIFSEYLQGAALHVVNNPPVLFAVWFTHLFLQLDCTLSASLALRESFHFLRQIGSPTLG